MLRAKKALSAILFLTLVLTGANLATAETYEDGPYHVTGNGMTAQSAENDAWAEAWDLIDSVEASLPAGHEIIQIVVEFEALTSVNPPTYEIDFHLVIEHELEDLPKGGPGQ